MRIRSGWRSGVVTARHRVPFPRLPVPHCRVGVRGPDRRHPRSGERAVSAFRLCERDPRLHAAHRRTAVGGDAPATGRHARDPEGHPVLPDGRGVRRQLVRPGLVHAAPGERRLRRGVLPGHRLEPVMVEPYRVTIYDRQLDALFRPGGEAWHWLGLLGTEHLQWAINMTPTRTGHLRSSFYPVPIMTPHAIGGGRGSRYT